MANGVRAMRLTIIGASRGIGRKALEYALERGHSVRALARSADSIPIDHDQLEKIAGSALSPEDVAQAIDGAEAVILCIGAPRDLRILKPTTLFSDAAKVLIPAMQTAGIQRLLAVTGFGAGDSAAKLSTLEKIPFKLILGRAYADKVVQEQMIKDSALDWTIARPGILNDNQMSKTYQVLVESETWRQGVISRADVGHYLIHAAEDGSHIHKTPAIQR